MSVTRDEIQCQGWLEKWASYTKGYRKRWFILQGDYLSYYASKTTKPDLTSCKGSMNLTSASVIREGLAGIKIIKQGKEPFFLRATCEAEMDRWVEVINTHLSHDISYKTSEQHADDECYGTLTPTLAFTTCTDQLKLNKMQKEDATLLGKLCDGVEWCASMGIVDLFAPGATMYIKIVGSLYPSVFDYFKEQVDIQQELVDLKIENALLGHALVDMKTDVEVIEDRFKQMINENTPVEDRKLEVVTAISSCKKILNCFLNPAHVFTNHPLVVSPHQLGFASLYACVAQVAVLLAPHYREEVKEAMETLVNCIQNYKKQVVLIRLGALTGTDETMASKAMSLANSVVPMPNRVSKYFDVNKVCDKMYPNPKGGFMEKIAFDRTGQYDGSAYREYRDTLHFLYNRYFNDAVHQIRSLKLDIVVIKNPRPKMLEFEGSSQDSGRGSSTSVESPKTPLPYPSAPSFLHSPTSSLPYPLIDSPHPLPVSFDSQVSRESVQSKDSVLLGFDALNVKEEKQ